MSQFLYTIQVSIRLLKQQFLLQIDGYLSPVTKENTIARKTTRFRTFPDYLLIQLKKFDIDEKWQPYKVLGIIFIGLSIII